MYCGVCSNNNILRHDLSGFDVIGYIFLGSCITMAVILTATTLYYRRKLKKLSEASQAKNNTNPNSGGSSEPKEFKKKKKKVNFLIDINCKTKPSFINMNMRLFPSFCFCIILQKKTFCANNKGNFKEHEVLHYLIHYFIMRSNERHLL